MESPTLAPTSTTATSSPRNLSHPPSPASHSRSSSRSSALRLDLSNLPPLTQPASPSNTLLITNLQNPDIFHPAPLQNIRNAIASHANILTWSPLRSFRRIVVTFATAVEATAVRAALDGSIIMGDRTRVYFGEHTPVNPVDQHLQAPEAKKLFFISPPPSPPAGWEMRDEEPPNAQVLAEDLAKALAGLRAEKKANQDLELGDELKREGEEGAQKPTALGRTRSGSVLLFEPVQKDGDNMPSISVDDFSDEGSMGGSVPASPISPVHAAGFHTQRPPVELMEHTASA